MDLALKLPPTDQVSRDLILNSLPRGADMWLSGKRLTRRQSKVFSGLRLSCTRKREKTLFMGI